MDRRCRQLLAAVAFTVITIMACCFAAFASDDNSLASLGIKTEGVIVSPEFRYDIWEYDVEVPQGTQTLELEPHTTNPTATVNSVRGNTLSEDGTGTVVITVTSESGNAIEYVLHVTTARGEVDPAEAIAANEGLTTATIDTEIVQSEVETEDPRYVKVDRNSLQDAENTIEKLQKTITEQRSHISMLTYVLYALIAVSIIFLFIVISQLLRRRDMAQELAFYKQEDSWQDGAGPVAEDGWGDWGEDEADRRGKKGRKKKDERLEDDWEDEPADDASNWASQQVGTPVKARNHPPRNGQGPARDVNAQRGQDPARDPNAQRRGQDPARDPNVQRRGQGPARDPNAQRRRQDPARDVNAQRRGQDPARDVNVQRRRQDPARDPKAQQRSQGSGEVRPGRIAPESQAQSGKRSGTGPSEDTRLYGAGVPVHPQEVPKDVTKDLSRVNKAEARAMKKAAAAEAKREQEANQAARNREQEAKRQAQEAERIRREQEAARNAQEAALKEVKEQRARQEAQAQANGAASAGENGKNVKIDMIDL